MKTDDSSLFSLLGLDCDQEEVLVPAVKGVMNVLESCLRSKTVKKVVVTSLVTAACPLSEKGEVIGCMDETTWTPLELFRKSPEPSRFYFISKVLTEQAALNFGEEYKDEIKVVTISPAIVGGPFNTSELPKTCAALFSFFTGDQVLFQTMKLMHQCLGWTLLIHTEDAINAHIFVMENPCAHCRHICASPKILGVEEDGGQIAEVLSQKRIDMGFEFKHGLDYILGDCVSGAFACSARRDRKTG